MFETTSPLFMVFVSTAKNAVGPSIFYFHESELATLCVSCRPIATEVSEEIEFKSEQIDLRDMKVPRNVSRALRQNGHIFLCSKPMLAL